MKTICMIKYVSKLKHSMISLISSVLTSEKKILAKYHTQRIDKVKDKDKDKEVWGNILWTKMMEVRGKSNSWGVWGRGDLGKGCLGNCLMGLGYWRLLLVEEVHGCILTPSICF